MNSWDEDPDELLRQRWQQTFADFEVQARPSLSRRILNALATGHPRKRAFRMANLLLMLLLGAGLFYPVQLGETPKLTERYPAERLRASPVQPHSRSRNTLATVPVGRSNPLGLSVTDPQANGSVTVWQPPTYLKTAPRIEASGVEASERRHRPTRQLSGTPPVSDRRVVVKSGPNPISTSRLVAKRVRAPRNNAPVKPSNSVALGDYERLSAPRGQLTNLNNLRPLPDSPSSAGQTLSNTFPTDIARLNPKEITSLSHKLHILPGQLPAIHSEPQASSVPVVIRHRHWFVEAVPLSCFQWMSTSPVSTAYVSQVNSLAAFSPATWGYQINGGIYFQHWQAHLSAGQLRRWAYYTVNENRYRVEPSPTNPHQLVRETQGVAENASLPVIGAGLSRVTLLAQGRYAVELGGQVSFLPTSGQRMVSTRGEIGRRLAINRNVALQVGITAEYGVNRLVSEQQQLVIHPFMVGIGLRVQPRSLN